LSSGLVCHVRSKLLAQVSLLSNLPDQVLQVQCRAAVRSRLLALCGCCNAQFHRGMETPRYPTPGTWGKRWGFCFTGTRSQAQGCATHWYHWKGNITQDSDLCIIKVDAYLSSKWVVAKGLQALIMVLHQAQQCPSYGVSLCIASSTCRRILTLRLLLPFPRYSRILLRDRHVEYLVEISISCGEQSGLRQTLSRMSSFWNQ
jgi:hypothetical protein